MRIKKRTQKVLREEERGIDDVQKYKLSFKNKMFYKDSTKLKRR